MFKNCKLHPGVTDPGAYHSQEFARGDARLAMSPSSLKAFGACPARWLAGYNPPESSAKDFGSLVDTLALTPELFFTRYSVHDDNYTTNGMECPRCKSVTDSAKCAKCKLDRVQVALEKPWNWNATECQTWKAKQGARQIVSQTDYTNAKQTVRALLKDEVIDGFFNASEKQVMLSGEWHDPATGLIVPVRCLLDFRPRLESEFCKSLGDLKTTRSAALKPFTRYVFQMGYHIQAAFDLDLHAAATGEDRLNWCFILQENYPPFQTGKRLLSEDFIELGRAQYRQLLASYCQCLKHGFWPGYDDNDESVQGWSLVAPEPWMDGEVLFAPKFPTLDDPDTHTEPEPENFDNLP